MKATRRDLLLAGAGAAALPVLGAGAPAAAQTGARTDAELLASIVQIEQVSALAYDGIARRLPRSDVALAGALELFAEEDREHAEAMAPAVEGAGGDVPGAPSGPGEVPGLERALDQGRRPALRFALALEGASIAAYYEAQGKLREPGLLRRTAEIMACQAQHQVVLHQALGRTAAPDPFVTGKPR